MTLGGWAISPQCFAWILDNVPSGSKVLEFGSGMGTGELVKHFDMTSIEQDSFWMNGFTGSRYIYAPIVDDWYSWEALENGNLENDYFLIIVDGPSKRMRKTPIQNTSSLDEKKEPETTLQLTEEVKSETEEKPLPAEEEKK